MKNNTGVSIVVLIQNEEHLIDRLLKTFFETNTHNPVEFIILDHSFTDHNKEVLKQYATRSFIRHIKRNKDFSIVASNNFAVQKTRYPHLLFLSDANVFTSDALSRAVETLVDPLICAVCNHPDSDSEYALAEKDTDMQHMGISGAFLLCRKADFTFAGGFSDEYVAGLKKDDFYLEFKTRLNNKRASSKNILVQPRKRVANLCILFVLPQPLDSNCGYHAERLAASLQTLGVECIAAVPQRSDTLQVAGDKSSGTGPSSVTRHPSLLAYTYGEIQINGFVFSDGRGPDVIHAWTPREGVRQFVISLTAKYLCPVIIHLEDNEEYLTETAVGRPFAELDKLTPNELDKIIPNNRYHPIHGRKWLEQAQGLTMIIDTLEKFNFSRVPSLTILPPPDERLFYPKPINWELRKKLRIPQNHLVIVYTGNVHAGNRDEVLILYNAVRMLNQQGHPTTLIRTGINAVPVSDGDETWIEDFEKSLGWISREEIPDIMAAADMFVQPGNPGPFNDYRIPCKLPEYFAMGRPVILPVTNLGLIVEHGREGYVLDRADAAGIVRSVIEISKDQDMARRLAAGGVVFGRKHNDSERLLDKLVGFYATLKDVLKSNTNIISSSAVLNDILVNRNKIEKTTYFAPKTVLCAIVKDEVDCLLEWIAYHKHIGFDQIIIYDNDSQDDTIQVLDALHKNDVIKHFPWPDKESEVPQLSAYKDALKKTSCEWICFLDADEFLHLPGENTIGSFLDQFSEDVGAVALNWKVFGSSGHTLLTGGLVIERFTRRAEENHPHNRHIKSIYRLKAVHSVHAHCGLLKEGFIYVDANQNRVIVQHNGLLEKNSYSPVCVHHYVVKSLAEYNKKKTRGSALRSFDALDKYSKYDNIFFQKHDLNECEDTSILVKIQGVKKEVTKLNAMLPPILQYYYESLFFVNSGVQKWPDSLGVRLTQSIPINDIPIVVVAYNRPNSLLRLLNSLNAAHYHQDVHLIISVDGGEDNAQVLELSDRFHWRHGTKSVRKQFKNLATKAHVLKCIDIALEFDGAVILEDDLLVSPVFYSYVQQAFEFYKNDDRIAGISLYSHQYNETARLPFLPIVDHSDVFFVQVPSSWGVAWTRTQWTEFKKWMSDNQSVEKPDLGKIPGDVLTWPQTSWKKICFQYLIDTRRFFVYPRVSLTTNFGESGVNMKKNLVFQVPLRYGDKQYEFISFENSLAKYDGFCEILPETLNKLCPDLAAFDYCVDLYGVKPVADMHENHALTVKKSSSSIYTFGKEMLPLEANIMNRVAGNGIRFAEKQYCMDSIDYEKLRSDHLHQENILYHYNISHTTLDQVFRKWSANKPQQLMHCEEQIMDNDLSQENKLLLLQLHLVQEELEEYYLKYQEFKKQ